MSGAGRLGRNKQEGGITKGQEKLPGIENMFIILIVVKVSQYTHISKLNRFYTLWFIIFQLFFNKAVKEWKKEV